MNNSRNSLIGKALVGLGVSLTTIVFTQTNPVSALVDCAPTTGTAGEWDYAEFTNVGSCRFTLPDNAYQVNVIVVAGGGAGGWSDEDSAAGGGAGGVAAGLVVMSGELTITVGAGGIGHQDRPATPSADGEDSSIVSNQGLVVAHGGAHGSGWGESLPSSGGSGSGAHGTYTQAGTGTGGTTNNPDSIINFYGNDGGAGTDGTGGGGGGATSAGGNGSAGVGGNGGAGIGHTLFGYGFNDTYAVGGGGCGNVSNGFGGGSCVDNGPGGSAAPNSGSGGGGSYNDASGSGGSGYVFIMWQISQPTTTSGDTSTTLDETTTSGPTETSTSANENPDVLVATGSSGPNTALMAVALFILGAALTVLVRRPQHR